MMDRSKTRLCRSQGIPVGIQLAHAGRKATSATPWDSAGPLAVSAPGAAWRTVRPSPIAHTSSWPTPHALSVGQIGKIVESFAAAARRAVEAGFDFIEIHGAHGHLIHSFLSPLANLRSDD